MADFAPFATPVVVADLPLPAELDRELAGHLLAEEQTSPGLRQSNVGGWHSLPDLTLRPRPCYRVLLQAVVDQVEQVVAGLSAAAGLTVVPRFSYAVQGWAMIMRAGDYTILHDHGDAHWSTVYYVDAGEADGAHPDSGRLAFVDPRRGGRPIPDLARFPSTFDLEPRTGSLVVFPGWLQHYVHAYRGGRPRIRISYNLVMEPPAG